MMRYLKRGLAVFLVAPMAPSAQPAMAATQLMEMPSRKFFRYNESDFQTIILYAWAD